MAVRVKVEPVKYEVSCKRCEAVLEYIGADIQSEEEQIQRSSITYYYIVCPVCNNKVYIQPKGRVAENDNDCKTASEVLRDLGL